MASVIFLLGIVLLSWTGYTESDDSLYAAAAWRWVQNFPILGTSHWALRHAIVLPMALLFRLFGRSEITLEAPVLLYYAALLVLTFAGVRRIGGWQAGLIAAVLLGAMPTLATTTSVVVDDVPEAFFAMASLWAFYAATRGRRTGLFVLSGLMAGLRLHHARDDLGIAGRLRGAVPDELRRLPPCLCVDGRGLRAGGRR